MKITKDKQGYVRAAEHFEHTREHGLSELRTLTSDELCHVYVYCWSSFVKEAILRELRSTDDSAN